MSDSDTPKQSASSWEAWVLAVLLMAAVVAAAVIGTHRFVLARRVSSKAPCISNLKQIDGAVQQWALENNKAATDTYSLSDSMLLAYMKGSVLPVCPNHGRYLPGTNISDSPRCTIGGLGHTL